MRKISFWLLWVFVFSVPWEPFVRVEWVGSMSRLFGLLVVGVGGLSILIEGRIRKPGIIVALASGFTLMAVLSLLWTIAFDETMSQVRTYVQLLGLVVLVWQFARTTEEQQSLILAYCLGAYVSAIDGFRNFNLGLVAKQGVERNRFAASNFDPNEFGLVLALGIPMAWYLFLNRRGIVRLIGGAYLPLAATATLLTASRAAFMAGIIAVLIVPLTSLRKSLRSWVMVSGVVILAVAAAATIVPAASWKRIFTAREEISSGSVGGRGIIWMAGWQAVQNSPVLGVGAGAFEAAVEPLLGRNASHNVLIAVLVEQGIAGLVTFVALLAACAWLVIGLPRVERKVWAIIALTWLAGVMTLDWQYSKVTWLLFALLAACAARAQPLPKPSALQDEHGGTHAGIPALMRRRQLAG
jgi:O-antigen ligase